jgi:hypothetical protein
MADMEGIILARKIIDGEIQGLSIDVWAVQNSKYSISPEDWEMVSLNPCYSRIIWSLDPCGRDVSGPSKVCGLSLSRKVDNGARKRNIIAIIAAVF